MTATPPPPPRERSLSRRLSSFFSPSNGVHPPSPPWKPTQDSDRPASRGRAPTKKLSKGSRSPSASATLLRPPSSYHPPLDRASTQPSPVSQDADPSDGRPPPLPPPPPAVPGDGATSRPSSRPPSRPSSRNSSPHRAPQATYPLNEQYPPPPPSLGISKTKTFSIENEKKLKRRSWLPGSRARSKSNSNVDGIRLPRAWIAAREVTYDVAPLANGQRVPELWDETGDTFVHLFPKAAGKGPSFRVHSAIFASSATLARLAFGDIYSGGTKRSGKSGHEKEDSEASLKTPAESRTSRSASPIPIKPVATESSSSGSTRSVRAVDDVFDERPRQVSLYVPILTAHGALSSSNPSDARNTEEDVESLIGVRNMFAFLISQSLIATEKRSSLFSIFLNVSDMLQKYGFTNLDASTFGEHASLRFDEYIEDLGLADVRMSREQTIESLVLGERMRSVMLYNEAFVHAVGKYPDIQKVIEREQPKRKFELLSSVTQQRMERAHIDLASREKTIRGRLSDFEFPSLFAGIMSSKTTDARKTIQFGAWKEAISSIRKHIHAYYKHKYGSWPPKASSKKNQFETSGLNRIVLKDLYQDFSDLYDLLVDRSSLTTRSNNDMLADEHLGDEGEAEEPIARVLRRIFDEYDRSTPPVQPPVPYDTPLLPMLAASKLSFTGDPKKDARVRSKKLKDSETQRLLDEACNQDVLEKRNRSQFLASFRHFERQKSKGANITEMTNLRAGVWIFLYAVLQALPMLVVDAPGVRHTNGVEYFLCEPPRSGVPWAAPDVNAGRGRKSRNWYGVAGGQGVVCLPSDLIEHGVEGIYRRSHCWLRAAEWSGGAERIGMTGTGIVDEPQSAGGAPEPSPNACVPSDRRDSVRLVPPHLNTDAPTNSPTFLSPSMQNASPYGSRPNTPGSATKSHRESTLALGLEALPLPPGVLPVTDAQVEHGKTRSSFTEHSRKNSSGGMTFDDIIAGMDNQKTKEKERRKSSMPRPFGH